MKRSAPQSGSRLWTLASGFGWFSGGLTVVLILAITVISTNVSSINRVAPVSEHVQASPYDGVTLYRGLFFASGPVATKIPTLRKAAPYFPAAYKSLEGQMINYMRQKDPTFFDRFAREIQSGDRVRVAEALRSTNKLQKQAVLEATKNSRTPFAVEVRRRSTILRADPETDKDKDIALVVVTDKDIAIVLIYVITDIPVAETPTELKGLKFEQYVDEVVRTVPRARLEVRQP